ncbi:MAG: tripartite tricarboxylate transporter substrate binding protein [Lachnospiraceae bacterium]|nr:tripartite tricarboxylate transporter substrate binding protein [Lachnospiraceae bacterium]MDO5551578.1 tripartite tricarboxylate transporter substrate binding protein [Lachnospiraceae bacterium]
MKKGRCLAAFLAAAMMVMTAGCSGSSQETTKAAAQAGSGNEAQAGDSAAADVKWPKNVEIIVPASAGGDTDFNARLFAQLLSEKLPANFVVSNVNGNGGATGTRQVKDAEADGSSVLFYHSAFIVNELCGATDYGFDSYNFACIAGQSAGNVVTVNSSLGISSLQELYDYTQAHPGELKMAAQTGATSYAVAMQMKQAGFDVNIVDAGSASDRLAALLGGHVDIILAAYGSIKDYVSEGDLVPLAMDGKEDLTAEGVDLKAMQNLDYDICLPFYYFFAFPAGTDDALVDQFNAAVKDIVENNTEYQDQIFSTYYQKPTYFERQEGLDQYQEVYDLLENVDFSA